MIIRFRPVVILILFCSALGAATVLLWSNHIEQKIFRISQESKILKEVQKTEAEKQRHMSAEIISEFDDMLKELDQIKVSTQRNKYCWDFEKYSAMDHFRTAVMVSPDSDNASLEHITEATNIAAEAVRKTIYEAIKSAGVIDCGGDKEARMIEELFGARRPSDPSSDPLIRNAYLKAWKMELNSTFSNTLKMPLLGASFGPWFERHVNHAMTAWGFTLKELGVKKYFTERTSGGKIA